MKKMNKIRENVKRDQNFFVRISASNDAAVVQDGVAGLVGAVETLGAVGADEQLTLTITLAQGVLT